MEDEIGKHTQKAYHTLKEKDKPLLEKVKEIAVEIAIIVFAVTISIWFHNLSEKQHQRKEEKEFLLGLKEDLESDIKEMENDKKAYLNQEAGFNCISSLKFGKPINKDTLKKYLDRGAYFGTTELIPNNGRFEGFKSAGKIGTIENTVLQNDIMDLYQENIPTLLASTKGYLANKEKFFNYFQINFKRFSDTTNNFQTLLSADQAKNYAITLSFTQEIRDRYQNCIEKSKKIIAEIDKQYGGH